MSNIRREKAIISHKKKVESNIGGYTYISSYFVGDLLQDGTVVKRIPHVRVRHEYCKEEYDLRPDVLTNDLNMKKGYKCPFCCGSYENSIHHNYPEIAKMISYDENKNIIDAKLISSKTHDRFYFACNECGIISNEPKRLDIVVNFNYSCFACSDGLSTPQKFVAGVLGQVGLNFKTEKVFNWSENVNPEHIRQLKLSIDEKNMKKLIGKKKYDFFIDGYKDRNIIIEVHGRHHYEETNRGRSLKVEKSNDILKKSLALLMGGIEDINYIEIDCKISDYNYMKPNIEKELMKIFSARILKVIDYEDAYRKSQKSLKRLSWELYNQGKRTTEIAEELNISKSRIRQYLHDGTKLGVCNYNPVLDRNANRVIVTLIDEKGINQQFFSSLNELYKYLGIRMEVYNKYIGQNRDEINIPYIEYKARKHNQYTKELIHKLKKYNGYKIVRV